MCSRTRASPLRLRPLAPVAGMRTVSIERENVMDKLMGSAADMMGLIMLVIFLAAGMKLWQQNREEKSRKP